MIRLALLALAPAALAAVALAQTPDPHAHHRPAPAGQPADPHAGHAMPAAPAEDPHAHHRAAEQAPDPHAGHRMPAAPADPHAGHAMTGADLPVGQAPAPAPPVDDLADAVWDGGAMARSRRILRAEHGGAPLTLVRLERLELRPGRGEDAFAWEGEVRHGGDVNRLVLKAEGEGKTGGDLHEAEVQALYSRAVGPYFDLQAGLRQDFQPRPRRTYAVLGLDGLAPYWIEVEGALFLSDKGDLSARLEASYDLRLTQRLILRPSAEANLAAQDVPELGVRSGLTDLELGLRLRYELRREFAPYVGVHYERRLGDTAAFARAAGEDVEDTRVVVGLRAWF